MDFCSYLSQKWIDLFTCAKLRPKWSAANSTRIVEYISPAKMLHFVRFVCNIIIREGRMSQRPPACISYTTVSVLSSRLMVVYGKMSIDLDHSSSSSNSSQRVHRSQLIVYIVCSSVGVYIRSSLLRTLLLNSWFLPRIWFHVGIASHLDAISHRPSVCPSVRHTVDQSKTVEVRIMQFSLYSSPIVLVFAR